MRNEGFSFDTIPFSGSSVICRLIPFINFYFRCMGAFIQRSNKKRLLFIALQRHSSFGVLGPDIRIEQKKKRWWTCKHNESELSTPKWIRCEWRESHKTRSRCDPLAHPLLFALVSSAIDLYIFSLSFGSALQLHDMNASNFLCLTTSFRLNFDPVFSLPILWILKIVLHTDDA